MTAIPTPTPATADDLDELVALDRLLFGVDAWSHDLLAGELTAPGHRLTVARVDGRVAGYADTVVVGDLADLLRIGVAPRYRRSGLAGRLLLDAVGRAELDGAGEMLLEVSRHNAGAIAFYRRLGFREIARRARYYRDGSDALVLRRQLTAVPGGADAGSADRMQA